MMTIRQLSWITDPVAVVAIEAAVNATPVYFYEHTDGGDIVSTGYAPIGDLPDGAKIGHADPNAQYIDMASGELRARRAMGGVVLDGCNVSGLPIPCRVLVDGFQVSVEDGACSLAGNYQGVYPLTVLADGYLPLMAQVSVTGDEVLPDGVTPVLVRSPMRRDAAIASLTVTVDGMVFDANEKSVQRMLAAIVGAETLGATDSLWRLADNTERVVTLTQLKQVQALAIQAIGWVVLS